MDLFENLNEIDIISDYDLYNEINDLKNEIKQEGGNILDIINQNKETETNMTFLKNLKEYNNYLVNQLGGTQTIPQQLSDEHRDTQDLIAHSTSDESHTKEKKHEIESHEVSNVVPTIPNTNVIGIGTTIFVAEYAANPTHEHNHQKFIHKHSGKTNTLIYNISYDNFHYCKNQEYSQKGNLHIHEFKVNKNITNIAGVTDLEIINLHQAQKEYIDGTQKTDPIKKKYEDLGHNGTFNGLIGAKAGEKAHIILFTNDNILDNLEYVKTHKIHTNGDVHSSVELNLPGN